MGKGSAVAAAPARASTQTDADRIAALEVQVGDLHARTIDLEGDLTDIRAALEAAGYPVDGPDDDEEE